MNLQNSCILMKLHLKVLLIIIISCTSFCQYQSYAQVGLPYLKNYSEKDYRSNNYTTSPQNWDIVQDDRGVMYFANTSGLLEFDGVKWRMVQGTNDLDFEALVKSENGTIYAAYSGDFGFLSAWSGGELHFISLKEKLDTADQHIDRIFYASAIGNDIYFQAYYSIYRWNGETFDKWSASTNFRNSFVVNNSFYVWQDSIGIMELKNDSLSLISNGEIFSNLNFRVVFMAAHGNDEILIATSKSGLFIWDGVATKPFGTQFYESEHYDRLYCGLKLSDGSYALGTSNSGLIIIDALGKLVTIIDRAAGLQNPSILAIYADKQNGLWLGLDVGIAHIEIPSAISIFNYKQSLEGIVQSVIRHDDQLYVATTQGTYYLHEGDSHMYGATFMPVKGLPKSTNWHLFSNDNLLLVATSHGVWQIIDERTVKKISNVSANTIHQSKFDPTRFFIGIENGLASIYFKDGIWSDGGVIKLGGEINSIAETEDRILWAASDDVYRLDFNNANASSPEITHFDEKDGLPPERVVTAVYEIKGGLHFPTTYGLYRFDEHSSRFSYDSTFGAIFANEDADPMPIVEDGLGNIWIKSNGKVGVLRFDKSGVFKWDNTASLRLGTIDIYCIYPEKNGITWYGSNDKLIRYDSKSNKNYTAIYPAIIRQVETKEDSIVFHGYYSSKQYDSTVYSDINMISIPTWLNKLSNSISFEFTAPYFDDENANRYSYYLQGLDNNWSAWNSESRAQYTNLPKGKYIFHVKSKNIYDQVGEEATFEFRVLPVWYVSSFAISIYLLMLLIIISGSIWLFMLRIKDRKERANYIKEIFKLSLVASHTDNSVMIANKNGKIEWANDGFSRMSGYTLDEIIGTHGEVLRKGEKTGLSDSQYFKQVIKEKKAITYEARNYSKDGKEYWALTNLVPIYDEDNRIQQVIAVDTDITERKNAEQGMKKAKDRAERSEKMREQFFVNMSHEIRTPMNPIIGNIHLLLKSNPTEEQKENLNLIRSSADDLLVIINDILDLSKIESGKLSFEETDFVLTDIISSLVQSRKYEAREKNLELVLEIDKNLPEVVKGDPTRFKQIVTNLMSNALKFTEKGKITLRAKLLREEKDQVKVGIEVEDTGIGIAEDKQRYIFDNFAQASIDTSRKYGGTGLGLTIAKNLLELQGGNISVKSKVDKGTTFFFEISYKKSKEDAMVNLKLEDETSLEDLGPVKILLVEDHPMNQLLVKKLLMRKDIKLDIADNGLIAIDKLEKNNYDIILMDIQMPEMDGYETTLHIRGKMSEPTNTTPILAMTAHATPKEEERCLKAGMNDFISKPIIPHKFYTKIIELTKKVNKNEAESKDETDTTETTIRYVDLTNLKELANDDKDFMLEMIEKFLQKTPEELNALTVQTKDKNWAELRKVAHKLKQSLSFIGAKELKESVASIEEYCIEGSNLDEIPKLVKNLQESCEQLFKELKLKVKEMKEQG